MSEKQVRPSGEGLAPAGLGRFGAYGGRYVPEALVAALEELDEHRLAYTAEAPVNRLAASNRLRRSPSRCGSPRTPVRASYST